MGFFAICIAVYIFVEWGSTTRRAARKSRRSLPPRTTVYLCTEGNLPVQLLMQLPPVVAGFFSYHARDYGRHGRQHVPVNAEGSEGKPQHRAAFTAGATSSRKYQTQRWIQLRSV